MRRSSGSDSCIPHDVLIDLVNEEAAMPTEKGGKNAILFTKEQFNAGLRFPLPALFKEFLHFSQIPPSSFPNLVRVLMGCSIINMLYSLDLTLLEVFFVYSLKKAKNDIFSVSAHLPSLQMVTELPDSTKGGAKGLVAVWGGWAGLSQHPSRPFSPNYTLKIPGLELRGHLVDWVEKASFACRSSGSPRNMLSILPRKLAKDEIVPGEHYTVKELPLYQEAKEADAERRRKLLEDRDQKKLKALSGRLPDRSGVRTPPPKKTSGKRGKLVKKHGKDAKEPTPPKEFPPPQTTYEGEVMIEEPVNAAPHSISSGPGRMSGLNHSGPSLVAAARLATWLRKLHLSTIRATLIRMQLKRPRWRKRGQKAKVSLPTTRIAWHSPEYPPSSSEEESADDAAPASPFSYAELEAKLKQITPDWKAIKPSAKMFDMIETLVRGLRSMSQQHVFLLSCCRLQTI
ncbi:hypothetical protein CK203_102342 [Vitis vinifera]|uniref:Uncharacterized protein n=1 Tax=Vitis vinifera TaxID=29760 RepID=A0A438BR41_VITVI|nr:hypothetical protein CK203_102342 [Vitis vinifera]